MAEQKSEILEDFYLKGQKGFKKLNTALISMLVGHIFPEFGRSRHHVGGPLFSDFCRSGPHIGGTLFYLMCLMAHPRMCQ